MKGIRHSIAFIVQCFFLFLSFGISTAQEPTTSHPENYPNEEFAAFSAPKEMNSLVQLLSHEISILEKTLSERITFIQSQLNTAKDIYTYYDTRVYEMSAVLYALDDQKVFSQAFYCKGASRLIREYEKKSPNFLAHHYRVNQELERLDKLQNSLKSATTLEPQTLELRNKSLNTCAQLEKKLKKLNLEISGYEKEFAQLSKKIETLTRESDKIYNSLFDKTFLSPAPQAHLIFFSPATAYQICLSSWKKNAASKFNLASDFSSIKYYGGVLLAMTIVAWMISRLLTRYILKDFLTRRSLFEKRYSLANVSTLFLLSLFLALVYIISDDYLICSAASLGAEFFLLLSGLLFSVVSRFEKGFIHYGVRAYAPYLCLGGFFMLLRTFMVTNVIVDITMPILFTLVTLISIFSWLKYRKKLPKLDNFLTTISLVLNIAGTILCWAGFCFMAFLILMTWIMLMASILLLVGLWDVSHNYEERYKNRHQRDLHWIRPFITKLIFPFLSIFLILFSFIWPADIFDMGDKITQLMFHTITVKDLVTFSFSDIILIILLAIVLNYLIFVGKKTLHDFYGEKYESGIIPTLITLSMLVIWGLFALVALIILDANYSGILMVMGGLSMGVGLAMKDTIDNLISGLSLMMGRLRQGDMIECDGYRGKVFSLGYRTTLLETLDGSVIAFHNSQLFNKNFRNMTRNHSYENAKVEIGVAYGTDIDEARNLILDELSNLRCLSRTNSSSVLLDNFGDNAVNLAVWVWVPVQSKGSALSQVREAIYRTFNEHHIEIPFPQQDVYIKEAPESSTTSQG